MVKKWRRKKANTFRNILLLGFGLEPAVIAAIVGVVGTVIASGTTLYTTDRSDRKAKNLQKKQLQAQESYQKKEDKRFAAQQKQQQRLESDAASDEKRKRAGLASNSLSGFRSLFAGSPSGGYSTEGIYPKVTALGR